MPNKYYQKMMVNREELYKRIKEFMDGEDYYGEWEDYVDYYNGEILDIIENFPVEESASIKGV